MEPTLAEPAMTQPETDPAPAPAAPGAQKRPSRAAGRPDRGRAKTGDHPVLQAAPRVLVLAGAGVLAWHPVHWLVATWLDPSQNSSGVLVFGLVAGLFLWSVTSPRLAGTPDIRRAWALVFATAGVRAAGRILCINVLGALALVIDVYALGMLCGLSHRRRAVAPLWLAVLFFLSLPIERIFSRTLGFVLQQMSARAVGTILGLVTDSVTVAGTRLVVAGREVFVDPPCSGVRGLYLFLVVFFAAAALLRPSARRALWGLGVALASAGQANVLRILALVGGLFFPVVDVMAGPAHTFVGWAGLAAGFVPLGLWIRNTRPAFARHAGGPTQQGPGDSRGRRRILALAFRIVPFRLSSPATRLVPSAAFLVAALAVLMVPARPVDVSAHTAPLELPRGLGPFRTEPVDLSRVEKAYFAAYGGAAAKARCGGRGLLAVRTTSPLRHLHTPASCLAGAGHTVQFDHTEDTILPTAVYRTTSPEGESFRVAVTFAGSDGTLAVSVSQALWATLTRGVDTWTMIQRIGPWQADPAQDREFDQACARAFDLFPLTSHERSSP